MAGQEDSCWRCGARWASEEASPTPLRAIAVGRLAHAVAELGGADTRRDDDRWTNEGGSVGCRGSRCPAACRRGEAMTMHVATHKRLPSHRRSQPTARRPETVEIARGDASQCRASACSGTRLAARRQAVGRALLELRPRAALTHGRHRHLGAFPGRGRAAALCLGGATP